MGKDAGQQKAGDGTPEAHTLMKYLSLLVLVLQNACQVLLVRHSKTRDNNEPYLSTSAVFFTEVVKLIACLLAICIQERSCIRCLSVVYDQIVRQPLDTCKVCLPALIYTIQNNLLYVAITNLDAAIYMVSYQLKILTTALFSVWVLHKQLSWPQWFSLVLLFGGVSLVNFEEQQQRIVSAIDGTAVSQNHSNVSAVWNSTITGLTDGSPRTTVSSITTSSTLTCRWQYEQNTLVGLLAVTSACLLSGFAGIYFEKILKNNKNVSVWLRNVQLAVLELPMSYATIMIKDTSVVNEKGLLYGYDALVWLIVFVSALGGLTVAVVIKYADNILKGFATSAAILVNCIAAVFLFDFWPSIQFMQGTSMVIAAIYIYSKYPYRSSLIP